MGDAEQLRLLLQEYFNDNARLNAKRAAAHAQAVQDVTSSGGLASTTPPPYVRPSFEDLQYWVYKSGHYAVPEKADKK